MESDTLRGTARPGALASLRRFLQPRAVLERCELCGLELAEEHTHLLEMSSRRLACACDACAVLFSGQGAAKYRRVPRRAAFLPDFRLDDLAWQALDLPISLAFFVQCTALGRVLALYPSPAGATEALVSTESWQALRDENPILRELEPDVEALLVNRVGEARAHFRTGIDTCYHLVGVIRTHWRGMTGGTAVWEEVGKFFESLKARA